MTFLVSFSNSPDSMWRIKNRYSDWLLEVLKNEVSDEPELLEILNNADMTHGICMDDLQTHYPRWHEIMIRALGRISQRITENQNALVSVYEFRWRNQAESMRECFLELRDILEKVAETD